MHFRQIESVFGFTLLLLTVFQSYSQSNIEFIQNKKQWNKNILFKTEIPQGSVYFENNCLTFHLFERTGTCRHCVHETDEKIQNHCFKVFFGENNQSQNVKGLEKFKHYYNYFLGKDKKKWCGNVPVFKEILYENIYQNIDFKYYSENNKLKYDIIIKAGSKPEKVQLRYEGVENLLIDNNNLIIPTSVSDVIEIKPSAFQIINNKKVELECNFILNGNTIGFEFPSGYNSDYQITIDPILVFSTYSGSYSNNFGFTASFDSKGFLYAGGISYGNEYPTTTGAFQTEFQGLHIDIALTKYDTTGQFLIYSTLLGGTSEDLPYSLFVNENDELYVLGVTGSSDFPVISSAFDTSFNGGITVSPTGLTLSFPNGTDIIVTRFRSDGGAILASTYIGGTANDGFNNTEGLHYNYGDFARGDIYVDQSNNCFIVASSKSSNYPTTSNSIQSQFGGGSQDGIITCFNPNFSGLIFSTYIGGSGDEAVYSIAASKNQTLYIAGGATSYDFPTTSSALHSNFIGGTTDAFISCINYSGTQLLYSTYFGSIVYDQAYFIQLDKSGNPYIYGQTKATGNTLIFNANFNEPNSGQFIAKFSPQLNILQFSTVFGSGSGNIDISPTAFLVDACNHIYVSGWGGLVNAFLFGGHGGFTENMTVTPDAFQAQTDSSDFYLMVLDQNASSLIYATFFGGDVSWEHVDGGTSRFNKNGTIYQSVCAGCGGHNDFPTTANAYSNTNNSGACNNAVFKFDFQLPITSASFIAPLYGCFPAEIDFENNSTTSTTFTWLINNVFISNSVDLNYTFNATGTYEVTLIANNPNSCNLTDTIKKIVTIFSNSVQTLEPIHSCNGTSTEIGFETVNPLTTFHWFPESFVSDPFISNPTVNVTDSLSLILVSQTLTCTDTFYQTIYNHELSASISNDVTICQNDTLIITTSVNSSENISNYIWSLNIDLTDSFNIGNASMSVTPDDTTTYYCQICTEFCDIVLSTTVNVPYINLNFQHDTTVCEDKIVQLNMISNNSNFEYHWQPESLIVSGSNSANPSVIITDTTIFVLTTSNQFDCIRTDSIVVNVSAYSNSDIELITPFSDTIYQYQTITLPTNYHDSLFFSWSPSSTLNNYHLANPEANPLQTVTYYLLATDSFGCQKIDSILIVVNDLICNDEYIFVPNAFSPNNDQRNDVLYIQSNMVGKIVFFIYDRLGNKVFETDNISVGWNGFYNGKLLEPQVFVYYLKATCWNGKVFEKKGNITLLK